MKTTIKINLSGQIFTLDEDAYQVLKDYLDSISKRFRDTEEGNEQAEMILIEKCKSNLLPSVEYSDEVIQNILDEGYDDRTFAEKFIFVQGLVERFDIGHDSCHF